MSLPAVAAKNFQKFFSPRRRLLRIFSRIGGGSYEIFKILHVSAAAA